ncbi:hypothetical protein Ancab_016624 [Ancistrocladus abbreviatus]
MAMEEDCNTGLALGLASYGDQHLLDHHRSSSDYHHHHQKANKSALKFDHVLPSLSLGPFEAGSSSCQSVLSASKIEDKGEGRSTVDHELCRQNSSISPGSSYSNNSSTVKKEKSGGDQYGGEEGEVEKAYSRAPVLVVNSDEDEEGSPRKKLRLTKEQSAILEDSFKEHSTLNPNQKQALAKQLNLRPRQVEVWFQNRRARTKLKQTEMDCELLKKCCQTLREENKRLQKELQELKALKLAAAPSPVYMQMPAATLSMCPSCERIISNSAAIVNDGSTTTPRARGPAALTIFSKQASQLCNPFSHPSATC